MASSISPGPLDAPPQPAPHPITMRHMVFVLLAGMIVCIVGTLVFLQLAAAVLANTYLSIDERVLLGAHTIASTSLSDVMYALTMIGDPVTVGVISVGGLLVLLRQGRRVDAAGLLAATVGALLLNLVLKHAYARVRPDLFSGPIHLNTYSFPSGHAMGSIAGYGMLAFLALRQARHAWHRVLVGLVTVLLIAGIALSRVYFGVHFPTDILGGLLAGAIWLTAVIVMLQLAEWEFDRRRARPNGTAEQALQQ
ncbi:MAG TPA: phosphatase PAP2 family protein [Roseiflexaceae bacterium]|nr:phosphatase PAP2 family protein [Roseiflexaceae bacterium]